METKARILQKAAELFFRLGIRSVTMDEIAAQCGVSKKTIYQFYEDKDALVDAIMDQEIVEKESVCLLQKKSSENAIHEVFLAMEDVRHLHENMHPGVIYDLQKHYPSAYAKMEKHKSAFLYSVVKENIERGKREGLYRKEIDSDILAKMRLEESFLPFRHEIFPNTKYHLSFVMQEMSDHFLHGLASPKGLELIEKYKLERNKTKINESI